MKFLTIAVSWIAFSLSTSGLARAEDASTDSSAEERITRVVEALADRDPSYVESHLSKVVFLDIRQGLAYPRNGEVSELQQRLKGCLLRGGEAYRGRELSVYNADAFYRTSWRCEQESIQADFVFQGGELRAMVSSDDPAQWEGATLPAIGP